MRGTRSAGSAADEGAFDVPGHWDPAVVPGPNDTALFEKDTATVDVGGIPAGGCAAPARTVGRLRVDDADLDLVGGALALSNTALEPASLALLNRGDLDPSAGRSARRAL